MKNRIAEFVDRLYEYFVGPIVMNSSHYMLPWTTGYSAPMTAESVNQFPFADDDAWAALHSEMAKQR